MAKHSQKDAISTFVCGHCKEYICSGCIDILRVGTLQLNEQICKCNLKDHADTIVKEVDLIVTEREQRRAASKA